MSSEKILLEAGTNEMELLVFRLNDIPFGVNVAKIREIIQRKKTIAIPHAPSAVEGSFNLREEVLTLINLGSYFGQQGRQTQEGKGLIVIVELNNRRCGVLVDSVERIYRLSWNQINAPSPYLVAANAPITGTVNVDGVTIQIIDFETIISDITGQEKAIEFDETRDLDNTSPNQARIMFADDSSVLRSTVKRILQKHGYNNLTVCSDGQQAWETIQERRNEPNGPFDLILSDIEMPRMDGLHLTSLIKSDPDLQNIPVVLFSSLITEDNRRKGESLGVDGQVSKPNSTELINIVSECLAKRNKALETAATAG